jgi:hypothetical protein
MNVQQAIWVIEPDGALSEQLKSTNRGDPVVLSRDIAKQYFYFQCLRQRVCAAKNGQTQRKQRLNERHPFAWVLKR